MAGLRFGKLSVSKFLNIDATSKQAKWQCICDCGSITFVLGANLRRGTTASCGCMQGPMKHGKSGSREYRTWSQMKSRCDNPANPGFVHYGARGITVCESWRNSFECFFADMGEASVGMSIDRIDVNLGYFKENCRWASQKQQNRNRRSTKLSAEDAVEIKNNISDTSRFLASKYQISASQVQRIRSGKRWAAENRDMVLHAPA